jgi:hypothetical protein
MIQQSAYGGQSRQSRSGAGRSMTAMSLMLLIGGITPAMGQSPTIESVEQGATPLDQMDLAEPAPRLTVLTQAIKDRVAAWAAANKAKVEIDYQQGDWMARDPKGAWLSTLLNVFGDTTGLEAAPVSTAGSTTAKLMANAINFGSAMPGKKYTAHNANEFKEVADLDADMQMFSSRKCWSASAT